MPTAFQALQARALAACDAAFAEPFTIRPMAAAPNERAKPDATRTPAAFLAQFFDESGTTAGESPGHANMNLTKVVSGRARILFAATSLPFLPTLSDSVTRTATSETFDVRAVQPDGLGRVTVLLTSRRAP